MTRRPAGLSALAALLLLAVAASGAPGAQPGQGRGAPYESYLDNLPARPSPPRLVNDFTGTLSASARGALERKLVAFDDSTGSQVAVVLVRTTDGVAPSDYATELGRAWGVGRSESSDGVVLLVATEDRDVFIATGYGTSGALTDATAGTIVRNVIVPAFRRGNFYGGIDEATTAIMGAMSGEFEAPTARTGGGEEGIPTILCCLFILFVFLVVKSSRHKSPPSSGGGGTRRRRRRGPGVIVIPSGGFGGGGGFGWGGFGGGFGGFGGGGFGGGGAGGSW